MSRTRSLTDLIADVRQRANMENSEFVTDSEITEYLNQELAELHARLVANEGQPHFRSSTPIAVTAGTTLYPLPADFWKVQEITASIGGIQRNLEPFMTNERARLLNAQLYAYSASPQYRVQAGNIEFLPSTQSFTATLFYVKASPRLSSGGDVVDGFNGYEIAAVYGAVAACLQKEESDASFYVAQKERILRHIDAVQARDGSHPERVTDVVGLTNILPLFPWE
jgi:hypothetical protein